MNIAKVISNILPCSEKNIHFANTDIASRDIWLQVFFRNHLPLLSCKSDYQIFLENWRMYCNSSGASPFVKENAYKIMLQWADKEICQRKEDNKNLKIFAVREQCPTFSTFWTHIISRCTVPLTYSYRSQIRRQYFPWAKFSTVYWLRKRIVLKITQPLNKILLKTKKDFVALEQICVICVFAAKTSRNLFWNG
jgi:hypothetical protein